MEPDRCLLNGCIAQKLRDCPTHDVDLIGAFRGRSSEEDVELACRWRQPLHTVGEVPFGLQHYPTSRVPTW
eukprot:2659565-Amphidinium_carterae.1